MSMTMETLQPEPEPRDDAYVWVGLMELELMANHPRVVELEWQPPMLSPDARQFIERFIVGEQQPPTEDAA